MKNINDLQLPFDPNYPSSLSKDRIHALNSLAFEAQIKEEGTIHNGEVEEHCLIIETCGMQEVYRSLVNFDTHRYFYENLDAAFNMLLDKRPDNRDSIFSTYTELSALFRTIAKQKVHIDRSFLVTGMILNDLDVLDEESCGKREGGQLC